MSASVGRLKAYGGAALLYLTAVTLVGFAIDGGIYSVLFNLYLVRMGFGPELIGLVNGVAQLTFAISALPAGSLGERFGVRQMLVLGLALMLGGCMLLPMADVLPEQLRLGWLLAGEVLLYFGLALYYVNTAPFLISMVSPQQRTSVFGVQSALIAIAAFAGGLVGGFLPQVFAGAIGTTLASPAPYRFPLLIAGLVLLPALLTIRAAHGGRAAAPPADGAPHHAARPHLTAPSVIMMALIMMGVIRMLQVCALAGTTIFFNVYMDQALRVPTAEIGTITAFGRLLGAPAALMTSALTRRFGGFGVAVGSTLATALMVLPMAFVPHWAAAGITLVGVVGLSSVRYAASMVYFMELVPPERRASVSGIGEMAAGVSFTLLTFAGGYIIAGVGYQALFLLGAALTVIGTAAFWLYFRRFEHRAA